MVMVCEGCFPNKPEGFYMDGYLKENLDILVKSIVNDFDFIILISGGGMTRIGKSLIGQQIGFYLNYMMEKKHGIKNIYDADNNFVFRGDQLISRGKEAPKYIVLNFDEAGSDLMARKTMHATTQAVLDYLRECGQKNQFLICILPDFFDLPKGVAITRSVCLIDVDFVEKFNRGKFKFYGRKAKKMLYLKGKKFLDYDAYRPDFHGAFTNFYTIDEQKYRQMKMDALQGREKQAADKLTTRHKRLSNHRLELIKWLHEKGETQKAIAERMGVSQAEISKIIIGEWS